MKILLDTNVILDHICSREPYAKSVGKIFDMICSDEIEAAFTAKSVTDIYYIVSKRLGDTAAREALRNLFDILLIIGIDGDDCVTALNLPMIDFEDAVITVCAEKDSIDYIISNDKEFLQEKSITSRVVSSDDILKLIS